MTLTDPAFMEYEQGVRALHPQEDGSRPARFGDPDALADAGVFTAADTGNGWNEVHNALMSAIDRLRPALCVAARAHVDKAQALLGVDVDGVSPEGAVRLAVLRLLLALSDEAAQQSTLAPRTSEKSLA